MQTLYHPTWKRVWLLTIPQYLFPINSYLYTGMASTHIFVQYSDYLCVSIDWSQQSPTQQNSVIFVIDLITWDIIDSVTIVNKWDVYLDWWILYINVWWDHHEIDIATWVDTLVSWNYTSWTLITLLADITIWWKTFSIQPLLSWNWLRTGNSGTTVIWRTGILVS